jgi:hypothetical protein
VFHLHGIDAHGPAVVSKRVSRAKLAETVVQLAPREMAMEACCGAPCWGPVRNSVYGRAVAAQPARALVKRSQKRPFLVIRTVSPPSASLAGLEKFSLALRMERTNMPDAAGRTLPP